MAVKNLQSVVCNVALCGGSVTNLDSKGYDVAMAQPPAMSSPRYPWYQEPASEPRQERGTNCSTVQAATRFGSLDCLAGIAGSQRGTMPSGRSWPMGMLFPVQFRPLAIFAANSADRDDQGKAIRHESLAGLPRA